ncbi:LegC family aminotransferase [Sphingobacterium luzhongxinii]|uniref:LegC family aminotransferase n=1 Tax=Sphingobacterium luzhongxinii TaxID=2654181 RepID=UPI00196A182D|nr:LegC family aminotransferase [Sphingobacterium sp. xlx-73]
MQKIDKIISFVRDHYKTDKFIPLHEPRFRANERKYVLDTIDSTFVSSVGAYVDKFEEMMQDFTGASKAVAVVNGTASLQVALRLAGVKAGDEVLTQALTFVATANAIVYNHAAPVFLDVDLDTMGLSPRAVSDFLEEYGELREDGCYNKSTGSRIAACMPMHTFGFPVHLDELSAVCNKWRIPLVEDAAESLGSYYKGKHTGTLGLVSGFSFNGNKTITCGGGGALITNDLELGKHAKYLTTTAKRPHPYEFFHDELGYNFRMPNLNAALACAQMEVLESFLADKRQMAGEYATLFTELGIKFRQETPDTKANYWLMCVELNDKAERENFLRYTNENGVMTRPIWNLMYRLPMYENCQRDSQRNAEFLEERIVNIPSSVR